MVETVETITLPLGKVVVVASGLLGESVEAMLPLGNVVVASELPGEMVEMTTLPLGKVVVLADGLDRTRPPPATVVIVTLPLGRVILIADGLVPTVLPLSEPEVIAMTPFGRVFVPMG